MRSRTYFFYFCAFLFVVLNLFKLHGFSIPAWHLYIDYSAPTEILLGKARTLRADDFVIELPLAFAQEAHDPPFPLENGNIGLGLEMAIPLKVPVAAPLMIFRPTLWGFFVSPDRGLAWNFSVMVVGLLLAVFLALEIATDGNFLLSLSGTMLFILSTHFPFWSFHKSEIVTAGCFAFFTAVRLANSSSWRNRLIWGVLLGWSTGCFVACHFYPPLMFVMVPVFLGLLVAFFFEAKSLKIILRENSLHIALLIAVSIAAFAIYEILHLSGDAFAQIRDTAYPGRRFSSGGEISLWRIFTENFFVPYGAARLKWGPLANASEAGSFVVLAPLIFLITVFERVSGNRKTKLFVLIPAFMCIAFIVYCSFGFPAWLSQILFLGSVPSKRAFVGIGFTSIFCAASWLASVGDKPLRNSKLILGIYALLMLPLIFMTKAGFPELSWIILSSGFFVHLALSALMLSSQYRRYSLFAFALVVAPLSLSFNPLVRGGHDYLVNNSLSKKILELQQASTKSIRWVVIARSEKDLERALVISNLPRILGVGSIGGVYCPPDTQLLAHLDPNWKTTFLNQCGHLVFILKKGEGPTKTTTDGVGKAFQEVRLTDSLLRELNVKYAILVGPTPPDMRPIPAIFHGEDLEIVPIPQIKQ
jgi:hypothetical protein